MSEAEKLLDSLDDSRLEAVNPESEPHIIINTNRIITVPQELQRIAVQFDHNAEMVTFDCPRYKDGLDMLNMNVYINYMTPDGTMGCYIVNKKRHDENNEEIMHFDWTISRNVTQLDGTLTFLVCVKDSDADGNELFHWNTELNTQMTIGKGMECDVNEIVAQYPDIIESLLVRMNELEAIGLSTKIDVQKITRGHQITITTSEGTQFFNVMDGVGIESISLTPEKGLKITMDDGSTYTTDSVQGPEGVVKDLNGGKEYKVFIGTADEWNAYEGDKTDVHWIPLAEAGEPIYVDHAEEAIKAEQDANGNVIHDTYATKDEVKEAQKTADGKGPKLYLHDLTLEGSVSDSGSSRTIKWHMQIVSKYATETYLLRNEWSRIISTFHFGTGYLTINNKHAHILNIRCASTGTYSAYFKITHPVPEAQSENDELATIVTKEYSAAFGEGATSNINVTNDDITELF